MDEDLTGRTGDLVAGLALFRDASVPAPSPELAALFAATAAVPSASPTARRAPMYKRILAGIPAKVAAGALGALLAGSVGAGALTGTMTLTSTHDDDAPSVESSTVDEPTTAVADDAPAADDVVPVDEVGDDGANDAAAGADLATAAVPTSVSEAAHTHDFDEACGNHGHYVSFFAQNGTEPDCAVQARAEAAGTAGAVDSPATDPVVDEDNATTDDAGAADVSTTSTKHDGKGKSNVRTNGSNWQRQTAGGGKGNKSKGGR